jgi:hypothetical protein
MSLIENIQAPAISESSDVSALLRKCKLLAARLDATDLARWVDHELNDDPNDAALPPYRIINGAKSYGHFVGQYSRAPKLKISLAVIPGVVMREIFRHLRLSGAISSFQSLLLQPDIDARIPCSGRVSRPPRVETVPGHSIHRGMGRTSDGRNTSIA